MAAENLCVLPRLNEAERHEYWAALALRHCRGLGARSARRLMERYGAAYAAILQVEGWPSLGLGKQAQLFKSDQWRESAKVEWDAARTLPGEVLLWTDLRYPAVLREIPDSPILLYVRGRTSLLTEVGVGIVGMRQCSERGARDARTLAGGLAAAGIVVVSGLAQGVDGHAHAAALDLPGSTIAVLGTGLDVPYPQNHEGLYHRVAELGLLVTELAPGTRPEPRNFPIRNRIISGLSMGVVVVEAAPQSGSLITARMALEQNRAVYAVGGAVGDPRSEGCQELIRQGAQPVFCAGDILSDLRAVLLDRGDTRLRIELPDVIADLPDDDVPRVATGVDEPPALPTPVGPAELGAAGLVVKKKAKKSALPEPITPEVIAPKPAIPATPLARRILGLLARQPYTIDKLCEELSVPPGQISAELIIMEVRRCVRRLPDTRYSLYE